MIVSIVRFEPEGVSPEEIKTSFKSAAERFATMPGLIRKICCYDAPQNICTIIYLWESREAAERCFSESAGIEKFREHFRCLTEIDYHHVVTIVDGPAA